MSDISLKDMAELLVIDERTVQKHAKEGIIVRGRGHGKYFLEKSVQNYVVHQRESAAGRGDKTLNEESALLKRAQRRHFELKNAELESSHAHGRRGLGSGAGGFGFQLTLTPVGRPPRSQLHQIRACEHHRIRPRDFSPLTANPTQNLLDLNIDGLKGRQHFVAGASQGFRTYPHRHSPVRQNWPFLFSAAPETGQGRPPAPRWTTIAARGSEGSWQRPTPPVGSRLRSGRYARTHRRPMLRPARLGAS
jgi:hypothetical protein